MIPVQRHVFYSLEGKNASDISPLWQILQVFFYVSCILLGFIICWLFTKVVKLLNNHCVLHAKILLTGGGHATVRGKNVSCSIEILQPMMRWNDCDVILAVVIVTNTLATFLMVMFTYCGRGGAGKPWMPDAWRIVWPAIIVNITSCFLVGYSAMDFTSGLHSFKQNIKNSWGLNATTFDLAEIRCLQFEEETIGEELTRGLYTLKEFIYLWVAFWSLNLVWILMRCIFNVDFQLVRTTVYEYARAPALVRRPLINHPEVDHKESWVKSRRLKFLLIKSDDESSRRASRSSNRQSQTI